MAAPKKTKRATIYLAPKIHTALKLKAAESDSNISDLVNEAVITYLSEDAEDLDAFERRKKEPAVDFATFIKQLKKDGEL